MNNQRDIPEVFDLRYVVDCTAVIDAACPPAVHLAELELCAQSHLDNSARADLAL